MESSLDGICELVLESRDADAMVDFYRRLGLRVLSQEGSRAWLEVGPRGRIGIWTPGEKEHRDRGGSHVHFALSVSGERLDQVTAGLHRLGWEFEGPITHEGGDRSLYLFDPEGNRLELWDYFEDRRGAPA